jgi:hypothetical protein
MSNKSFFVISLDFELYWGMFDKVTLQQYGENIRGAHTAIPEILALFKQHNIHATWATVGMLMTKNQEELSSLLPAFALQPQYRDMKLSAYTHLAHEHIGTDHTDDPHHFGAYLVEKIIQTPGQELASHTFSHYYTQDGSENSTEVFAADCAAFTQAAKKFGVSCTSVVFPRNQTTASALAVCAQHGFTAYRGTPSHVLYTGKKESEQTNPLLRLLRLIDAYVNISGHHTFSASQVRSASDTVLCNVPGSFFFRPYSKRLRVLEKLRITRIKNSMTYAAQHGEVFHLWWHPHNFGINRKENMQNLLEIIAHFTHLKERYGMQSANMREIATLPLPSST